MNTVYADLNARTQDDRIRLDWEASAVTLKRLDPRAGDWIWIGDEDLRVGAQVEVVDGTIVARPAWETAEDLLEPSELSDREKQTAKEQLRLAIEQPTQVPLAQVLHLLPRARPLLPQGFTESLRGQALARAGYPELALLSFDEAIARNPQKVSYRWHRLRLLADFDLPRAVIEADQEISNLSSIVILDVCVQVLSNQSRQLHGKDRDNVLSRLLEISGNLTRFADYAEHPEAATSLLVTRGFAQLARNDRDAARREFSAAIAVGGNVAEAYAARGATTYPSPESVADLKAAADRGSKVFLPYYYLAHHYLTRKDWMAVRIDALRALSLHRPVTVTARLLEWLAIADVELDADVTGARNKLRQAASLLPTSPSIQRNLAIVNSLDTKRHNHDEWIDDFENTRVPPAFLIDYMAPRAGSSVSQNVQSS